MADRRGFKALLTLFFSSIAILLVAGSAAAAVIHPKIGEFDGSDTTAGPLSFFGTDKLAVDQNSGDVYVLDKTKGVIAKFNAAGVAQDYSALGVSSLDVGQTCIGGLKFQQAASDIAVDGSDGPGSGNIYVEGDTAVCAYDSSGEFLWRMPVVFHCGLTVDTRGFLLVTEPFFKREQVKKFGLEGSPPAEIGKFEVSPNGGCYPAIDDANNLYVVRSESKNVDKYRLGQLEKTVDKSAAEDLAVDPVNSHLYVRDLEGFSEYDSDGNLISHSAATYGWGIGVNGSTNTVYVSDALGHVSIYGPYVTIPDSTTGPVTDLERTSATLTGEVGLDGGPEAKECLFKWGTDENYGNVAPCDQATPFTADTPVTASLSGLEPEVTYHYRLVAGNDNGSKEGADRIFTPHAVLGVTTGAASEVQTNSATIGGSLDPDGIPTEYRFEYGPDTKYEFSSPLTSAGAGTTAVDVSAPLSDLAEGQVYHYRLIAQNEFGTTVGEDETFATSQPPTIDAAFASEIRATSAQLNAKINPHGAATHYHFEYGTTANLGSSLPIPDGELAALDTPQDVSVQLSGLQPGITYLFRVVATSDRGTRETPIQPLDFLPPDCPNATLRQQTGAGYLPDCRAYELVSPANAGGTTLYSGGPTSPDATSPSRMAFVGAFGQIPGTGNPVNNAGDLYVATRTNSGWETKYIGLQASKSSAMSGFPSRTSGSPDDVQDQVLTNPSMSLILDWSNGLGLQLSSGQGLTISDFNNQTIISNAPYVWSADGGFVDRWPTNLAAADVQTYPCSIGVGAQTRCTTFQGDMRASRDLSHLVYSSIKVPFAPGGRTTAPGSVYDNDTATGTTTIVSRLPNGQDIEAEESLLESPFAAAAAVEPIRISQVSEDGSHILMATASCPATESATGAQGCDDPRVAVEYPQKVHLYMSVDGITYDVTRGRQVDRFIGMTNDGSTVYFSTTEQMTDEDHDSSADIYRWTDNDQLTLVSIGNNGAGNSDACNASWTTGCSVKPLVGKCPGWEDRCTTSPANGGLGGSFGGNWSDRPGGAGGSGLTDNPVAGVSGDLYFTSPERLDGTRGIDGQQNLYVFREGAVQFVSALTPGKLCITEQAAPYCSSTPILRIQVSPTGGHAAFLTASRMTSYDNGGKPEMYLYEPGNQTIECASCRPDGTPPTSMVEGSQNGLFMTDDGRVFFSTKDGLVPQDTNKIRDVYEFSGGSPRLISAGTGSVSAEAEPGFSIGFGGHSLPGLTGVSRDGRDVFFATFDTLVGQDQNGNQLKFYDARSNGGFAFVPLPPPCEAADECHGVGSSPVADPIVSTGADFGKGGNAASPPKKAKKAKHAKRKAAKKKRHAHRRNGGKR